MPVLQVGRGSIKNISKLIRESCWKRLQGCISPVDHPLGISNGHRDVTSKRVLFPRTFTTAHNHSLPLHPLEARSVQRVAQQPLAHSPKHQYTKTETDLQVIDCYAQRTELYLSVVVLRF